MIESDLKHRVTYTHRVDDSVDEYNQPTYTETAVIEKCFFDVPKNKLTISEEQREVAIEAQLFMDKDSRIVLDDIVTKVEDSSGVTISDLTMRVVRIVRASDFSQVHHLEVLLAKS